MATKARRSGRSSGGVAVSLTAIVVGAVALGGACKSSSTSDGGVGEPVGGTTTTGTGSTTDTTSTSTHTTTHTTTTTKTGPCGGGCPEGLSCCTDPATGDLACIDTSSNRFNCGKCGAACEGLDYCVASKCVTPSDAGACDPPPTCSPSCGDGQSCSVDPSSCKAACCTGSQVFCGGKCILPSDNDNCGACGAKCDDDKACGQENGVVSCLPVSCGAGSVICHHGCIDVQSDPLNCGSCGNACGASVLCGGGVCCQPAGQAGVPKVLFGSMPGGAGVLSLGGGMVIYFDTGTMMGVPVGGGATKVLASAGDDPKIGTTQTFAGTATSAHWTNLNGQAFSKPINGGAATKLVDDPTLVSVSRIVGDANGTYYGSLFERKVWAAPTSPGDCPDPQQPLCARLLATPAAGVGGMAITATHVYFTAGGVYRVNRTGAPVVEPLVDVGVVAGDGARLAIAGSRVVWGNTHVAKGGVAIGSANLDGTSPLALFKNPDDAELTISDVVGDAQYAYFAGTGVDATIRRVAPAGGCPELVAKLTKTGGLVADASTLYFADILPKAGDIDSLKKP
jgi:hypothetical protein